MYHEVGQRFAKEFPKSLTEVENIVTSDFQKSSFEPAPPCILATAEAAGNQECKNKVQGSVKNGKCNNLCGEHDIIGETSYNNRNDSVLLNGTLDVRNNQLTTCAACSRKATDNVINSSIDKKQPLPTIIKPSRRNNELRGADCSINSSENNVLNSTIDKEQGVPVIISLSEGSSRPVVDFGRHLLSTVSSLPIVGNLRTKSTGSLDAEETKDLVGVRLLMAYHRLAFLFNRFRDSRLPGLSRDSVMVREGRGDVFDPHHGFTPVGIRPSNAGINSKQVWKKLTYTSISVE